MMKDCEEAEEAREQDREIQAQRGRDAQGGREGERQADRKRDREGGPRERRGRG